MLRSKSNTKSLNSEINKTGVRVLSHNSMKNLLALVINIFTFVALRMLEEYSIYPMFFAFALAYLTYQNVVYRGLFFYASREFTTFWPLWWRVSYYESLSIRVQSTLNNISICFFIPQYQRQRKGFFCFHRVSEPELKKALHDILRWAALSQLLPTTTN